MKPLSLTFTAFGPYPGTETVDFTLLAELGLYVVTGPTGSGKTTIFDAMAYALYGEVPGARDKSDVRSQHADPEATCSVVFRFAVDGIEYRVSRTPEQYRPRLRGDGGPVEVPAKAELVRESDGTSLASQLRSVRDACIELVGLKGDQFERVVLLPQGQFQQFLLADTAARLLLLRQLFGTGKWQTVVDELKSRAREANDAVAEIEAQLQQHIFAIDGSLTAASQRLSEAVGSETDLAELDEDAERSLDLSIEFLASKLEAIEVQLKPLIADSQRLSDLSSDANSALAAAQNTIAQWDRRNVLLRERDQLTEQIEEIERLRKLLATANAAQPVIAAATERHRDAEELRLATTAIDESRVALNDAAVAAGLEVLDDPDGVAEALVMARADLEAKGSSIGSLAEASTRAAQLHRSREELSTEGQRVGDRVEEIELSLQLLGTTKTALEESTASAPALESQVEKARDFVTKREALAELGTQIPLARERQDAAAARQREAIRAFDDSAAPRLAESLEPGHACPVCGSLEHPSPAIATAETAVSSSDRDAASKAAKEASEELDRLGIRQEQLLIDLGDAAARPLAELQTDLERLESEYAEALKAQEDLRLLLLDLEAKSSELTALNERRAEIALGLAGIEPRITASNAAIDSLIDAIGVNAAAWLEDPESAMNALDEIAGALDVVDDRIAACREALRHHAGAEARASATESAFSDVLASSPFATLEEAAAVALPDDERHEIESKIGSFETQFTTNSTLLDESLTFDLPEVRPDATELELAATTARTAAEAASDAVSQITGHVDLARSNLLDAQGIAEGSADAVARSNSIQALAKTCDGQGPKKVALETWVLAGELDRVAAAANHHLNRMTSGRYQIERSDASSGRGQSGLELRVLDAHTGSSRRPGSLSGGEQFQASLALALGLADVIGHGGNANGRVFEALFVDEGFGSLDPASLDQAVDALVQIQASGRAVGVITHVEAMKESLPIGIRVERLADGKGSTLGVRPND